MIYPQSYTSPTFSIANQDAFIRLFLQAQIFDFHTIQLISRLLHVYLISESCRSHLHSGFSVKILHSVAVISHLVWSITSSSFSTQPLSLITRSHHTCISNASTAQRSQLLSQTITFSCSSITCRYILFPILKSSWPSPLLLNETLCCLLT